MPHQELAYRKQKAVLWPLEGTDGYGQPVVSDAAVELDVRWVAKRSEVLDPQGRTIAVDATAVVDREIAVGSSMWLGELAAFDPDDEDNDVMEVKAYNETPDIKNRVARRTVGLLRRGESLPEQT